MIDIKTVTVIGANGTMGTNVAAIFASFGNAKVYMVSRTKEASENAIQKAIASVKADAVSVNLIAVDYSELDKCISESDFIFESVSENLDIKKNVYQKMLSFKENVIVSTGTSGLSINQLKEYLPQDVRSRFFGVHFFNPPYNMPLCELIPNNCASESLIKELKDYLSNILLRKVIIAKDNAAFIGNRIGFYFINIAMLLAEKYKADGGIDYIDSIIGGFTGRNIPPIVTADFVGLDIYSAIINNLAECTSDYQNEFYSVPSYAIDLIDKGFLGRKCGKGLYTSAVIDGLKQRQVYDIATGEFRSCKKYSLEFADSMVAALKVGDYFKAIEELKHNSSKPAQICREMLLKYIVYGIFIALEVGESAHDADTVMAEGFNWIPPLALIDSLGGKEVVINMICNEFEDEFINIDYRKVLLSAEKSKYDYRKFFKAKR